MVYPDFTEKDEIRICSNGAIRQKVKNLWDNVPKFRDSMKSVPTQHVPNKKGVDQVSVGGQKIHGPDGGQPRDILVSMLSRKKGG